MVRVLVLGAGFGAPSTDLTGHKSEFVATRIQRWLGRDVRHPQ
jgi:hypothetical protein